MLNTVWKALRAGGKFKAKLEATLYCGNLSVLPDYSPSVKHHIWFWCQQGVLSQEGIVACSNERWDFPLTELSSK